MNVASTARYQFKPNQKKEGYIIVYDLVQQDAVVELWREHATIIMLMYQNLLRSNVFAANEFMYGHIMGITYTLMFADKYPKVELIKSDDGLTTTIKMTDSLGAVREIKPSINADAREQLRRTNISVPGREDDCG